MVNYKAIADAAQAYANADAAFAAMSAETTAGNGVLSGNDLRLWAATYTDDYTALKAATDVPSEMALTLIQTPDSKLDIGNTLVKAFVTGLSISVAGRQGLYDMSATATPVWPNLKLGHVVDALAKRQAGEV